MKGQREDGGSSYLILLTLFWPEGEEVIGDPKDKGFGTGMRGEKGLVQQPVYTTSPRATLFQISRKRRKAIPP